VSSDEQNAVISKNEIMTMFQKAAQESIEQITKDEWPDERDQNAPDLPQKVIENIINGDPQELIMSNGNVNKDSKQETENADSSEDSSHQDECANDADEKISADKESSDPNEEILESPQHEKEEDPAAQEKVPFTNELLLQSSDDDPMNVYAKGDPKARGIFDELRRVLGKQSKPKEKEEDDQDEGKLIEPIFVTRFYRK
jgi:hypothetical protein